MREYFLRVRKFVRKHEQPIVTVAAVTGCTVAMGAALTKTAGAIIVVGGVLVAGYYGAEFAVGVVNKVKG